MNINKKILATGAIALAFTAAGLQAKVSSEEAAKLGTVLTPMGAEKAGNADGTIPAWTGGIAKPPSSFVPDSGFYPDPFPQDKVLFTIDASNMAKYADKLTDGQKALLTKYPGYKMPVFESRRSAAYPQSVYDAAKKNATSVELVAGGNGLTAFEEATPFPVPNNGLEVIWNHIVRYRGGATKRNIGQVTPMANGDYSVVKFQDEITWRDRLADADKAKDDNVLFYFKQIITAPSRLAGNVLLVHETIDQVKEPRRAWVYNAGQRRVRRAPQVAYDGPGTASDGLRTSDNYDMYNGSPDRYDWKLIGKVEKYIPYNSYRMSSQELKYDELVMAGHLNQDYARYELHRVWQVEATLKSGQRHIYARRVFYIDEDTWSAATIDHYDGRGELWRVAEAHLMTFYDVKTPWYALEVLMDLQSGRYLALGLMNEEKKPYTFGTTRSSKDYTPAALRRAGKR
ncbi:MAG: outer membrane lipoprotein-sorting protein [Gammaproteobacteria bacterium]|nr:MAG: outer membrane lipoprotein-sorting protein [Gammaproteobacteria bacterium]